jgi:hypothetical protein
MHYFGTKRELVHIGTNCTMMRILLCDSALCYFGVESQKGSNCQTLAAGDVCRTLFLHSLGGVHVLVLGDLE